MAGCADIRRLPPSFSRPFRNHRQYCNFIPDKTFIVLFYCFVRFIFLSILSDFRFFDPMIRLVISNQIA